MARTLPQPARATGNRLDERVTDSSRRSGGLFLQFPVRFSIVTYNLWGRERWPERAGALGLFLGLYTPDVMCVQELVPETQKFLDERLADHARVDDPLPGWHTE
ncbi:MAG: hypothetical protein E6G60_09150, partial [Actinobacteria bacterium]